MKIRQLIILIDSPSVAFNKVVMDIVEPLMPKTRHKIITIQDLTKFMLLFPSNKPQLFMSPMYLLEVL
jgi:hypothetical protein